MSNPQSNAEEFRHWAISDYTTRYQNGTTTPSKVVKKIINIVQEMNINNNNKSIVTHINIVPSDIKLD